MSVNLLDECRKLGTLAAWRHDKWAQTGVECAREHREVIEAYERVDQIADIIGDQAREVFAEGYDATIDFSLNSDWRLQKGAACG